MIKKVTPVPGFIDRLQEKEKITQIDISKKSTLSKDVLRKINDGKSVKLSTIQKLTKLDSVNLEDLPIKKNNYDDYETLDFCHYEFGHPDWMTFCEEKEKISKIDFIPSKVNNYDEFKRLIKTRPDKKFFRMNGPTEKLLNENVKQTIKGLEI